LKKDKEFNWTAACDQSFRVPKESLRSSKVLVHFNSDLPIVLECDASQYGIGADGMELKDPSPMPPDPSAQQKRITAKLKRRDLP